MGNNKKKRDIISEQAFNKETLPDVNLPPEKDSPGDGDESIAEEYLLGVNYMPDEKNEYENEGRTDQPPADESSTAPSEMPDDELGDTDQIPKTAQVVSSDFPAPLKDVGRPSDTH